MTGAGRVQIGHQHRPILAQRVQARPLTQGDLQFGSHTSDAEAIDGIPGARPRARSRHSAIWIRLEGAWCQASILDWVRGDGGEWLVWVQHDSAAKPWPELGLFRYAPNTIMRRDGSTPPA